MKKRIAIIALLFVAIFLSATVATSFDSAAVSPADDFAASSARFALVPDLLLAAQNLPIRQFSNTQDRAAIIGAPFQFAFESASLLSSQRTLFNDVHFKMRAFQIQTARWCAS